MSKYNYLQFAQLPIEYILLIKTDYVASQLNSCTLQNMYELFHCVSHHMHNSPFNCQNLSGIYTMNIITVLWIFL